MPWRNIARRRAFLRNAGNVTPPPGPNPPLVGLLARYVSSMVNGVEDGVVNPLPDPGPIAEWQPAWGTAYPLVSDSDDPEAQPQFTVIEEDGISPVLFSPTQTMSSLFAPPAGGLPRTVIIICAVAEGISSDVRLIGYGQTTNYRAFDMMVTADAKFGYRLGSATVPSDVDADGDIHLLGLITDGEEVSFIVDGEGPTPASVDLDTAPAGLVVGGDGSMYALEILVYDHPIDGDEFDAIREYAMDAYDIGGGGGGGLPSGRLARWVASNVNGDGSQLPNDSTPLTSWVSAEAGEGPVPDLTQAVSGSRPTFLQLNGRPRVRLSPGKLLASSVTMPVESADRTIVLMGVNWHQGADQRLLTAGDGGDARGNFALCTVEGDGDFGWTSDDDTFVSSGQAPATDPHLLILTYGGGATAKIFVDGSEGPPTSIELATAQVGLILGDASAAFDAYEVLVWSRALNSGEIDRVREYFTSQYSPLPEPTFPDAGLGGRWQALALNGLDSEGVVNILQATGPAAAWHERASAADHPLAQATSNLRPTFFLSAVPFLRFSPGQFMTAPTAAPPTGSQTRTLVVIGTSWSSVADQLFVHYGDMDTDNRGFGIGTDGSGNLKWFGGGATGGAFNVASAPTQGYMLVVRYNGTQVRAQVNVGPPTVTAASLDTDANGDPLTVGNADSVTGVDAYEVLFFLTNISDQQLGTLYGYAQGKYGNI